MSGSAEQSALGKVNNQVRDPAADKMIERVLLNIDRGLLGASYRIAVGFAIIPAASMLLGRHALDWAIIPFLLATLLLLRGIPAIIRKLVSFPPSAREAWAASRRTAKKYDSYQWRKLTWIGTGLFLYMAVSGQLSTITVTIGLLCILAGAIGMVTWWAIKPGANIWLARRKD